MLHVAEETHTHLHLTHTCTQKPLPVPVRVEVSQCEDDVAGLSPQFTCSLSEDGSFFSRWILRRRTSRIPLKVPVTQSSRVKDDT